MPLAGFEPATPATKRPQTYALDRATTGIGKQRLSIIINFCYKTLIIFNFCLLLCANNAVKQDIVHLSAVSYIKLFVKKISKADARC
jgi:hypothetical protein